MNNLKKLALVLTAITVITSCGKKDKEEVKEKAQVIEVEPKESKETVNFKAMTFASKSVADIMDESDIDSIKLERASDPNFSKILNGDFDIAAIPAYLAPNIYNKTNKGIEVAAITQTGNLYLVSDTKLNSQNDYRNKNFYIPDMADNLKGAIDKKIGPINFLLRLNLEYYKSMDDIVEKMDKSSSYVAILSDPYYTKSLRKTQYVSNVEDLLPIGGGDFISEVIVVNKEYLKDNKKEVDEFLSSYEKSVKTLNDMKELSNETLSNYDITEDEAKLALDRMNITFISGSDMKEKMNSFIEGIASLDRSILGGEKPADDFYYGLKE